MVEETTAKTAAIQKLNDDLRTGKSHDGQIMITAGINEMGAAFKSEVAKAVADFDAFTADNNPHLEHDFGALEVQGHKVFFKFDYYDLTMKMHSPDPSNPMATKRVLTIMLAEEY